MWEIIVVKIGLPLAGLIWFITHNIKKVTQQKFAWIKIGFQGLLFTLLGTVIISVGDSLGGKLTALNNKLDKIDSFDKKIGVVESKCQHFDSLFTMQILLNDNRQKGEWELDKKTDGIMIDNVNIHSDVDRLYSFFNNNVINKK